MGRPVAGQERWGRSPVAPRLGRPAAAARLDQRGGPAPHPGAAEGWPVREPERARPGQEPRGSGAAVAPDRRRLPQAVHM